MSYSDFEKTAKSFKKLFLLTLFLMDILLICASCPRVDASGTAPINGLVIASDTWTPILNATITVWRRKALQSTVRTDNLGRFSIPLELGYTYTIYANADNPATPGIDYVPSRREVSHLFEAGENLTIQLEAGASVLLEGDVQFVDTENLPVSVIYKVLDPDAEKVFIVEGLPLVFGDSEHSQSYFLGLNSSYVIVPAETPFLVAVNASVLIGGKMTERTFYVDESGHFTVPKGESIRVDVRKYSVQYNLAMVEAFFEEVEERIYKMDIEGFYLNVEKRILTETVNRIDGARLSLLEGRYIESFDSLRSAYLSLMDLSKDSLRMYYDARLSVYILIFFIAFASTTISFFLADSNSGKLGGSLIASMALISALHFTYPGSGYISTALFIETSILATAVAIGLAVVLPRFLKTRRVKERVSLRNVTVPIFSIAKRSLRRRRLRFALTSTSLTIFVMSFVFLTSFSMGYGLVSQRISGQKVSTTGVVIRDASWKEEQLIFIALDQISLGWLDRQPESRVVAPKAENLPKLIPSFTLSWMPIPGIIGIDPRAESLVTGIDEIVVEGAYLKGGAYEILISQSLKETLDVDVGSHISLSGRAVTVAGIFDDSKLRRVRDLDGSKILPRKLVNISPSGAEPEIVLEICEPGETVICTLETALSLPLVGVSRIDIATEAGEDPKAFAERIALERGYNVWASSPEGLYISQLSTYLQGKGLPVLVPGVIVVLNVVVTMLNSMYERRGEIHILSSVGLNPAQIAAIFVAEASIIGIVGGGIGYTIGLGFYKIMAFLQLTIEVRQKISALWSLGAVGISMTAAIVGATLALKSSVIITPSLMRRWRIEKQERTMREPWEITIPIKVLAEEVEEFFDYVLRVLRSYIDDPVVRTDRIKTYEEETEEAIVKRIRFIHRLTRSSLGDFYTTNNIILEKRLGEDIFSVKLLSSGESGWAHRTGTFVRQIAMGWSAKKGRSGST